MTAAVLTRRRRSCCARCVFVAAGDAPLSPSVSRRMLSRVVDATPPLRTPPPGLADLTERERDVFALVAHGDSNQEIADRLHISEATVKTHVSHLLDKLGLRDRVQAVVLAYESGLVTPGDAA